MDKQPVWKIKYGKFKHKGVWYGTGDMVEVPMDIANKQPEGLLSGPIDMSFTESESSTEAGEIDLSGCIKAIAELVAETPRDKEKWAANKPKVNVLSEMVGRTVKAPERDSSWTAYQEANK